MTSKLKCPFCGEELEDAGIHSLELYFCCTNCYMKQKEKDDNYTASPIIWQALIQAKQDLEQSEKCCSAWETQALDYKAETIALSGKLGIARKALEELRGDKRLPAQTPWEIIAEKALEQIEHKE